MNAKTAPKRKTKLTYREQLKQKKNPPEDIDCTPMVLPSNMQRPPSLEQEIARFVRTELSARAAENENDTFEEANDFTEDDPDVLDLTPYELAVLEPDELGDPAPPEPDQAPQEADLPADPPPESTQTEEPAEAPEKAPQEKTKT